MKPSEAREEAIWRIEQARQDETYSLDLGDLPLRELPAELGELSELRVLVLGNRDFRNEDEEYSRRWWVDFGRDLYPERWFDNLEALRPLTELTALSLNDCRCVSDFSAIAALSKLRKLDLAWCDAPEIEYLAGLHGLRELDITSAQVRDIGPLAKLTNLRVLILRRCEQLWNILTLGAMVGLRELDLRECERLTDLGPLSQLINLWKLDLGWCKGVTSLERLAELVRLEELGLERCTGLRDISPLARMTDLQSLNLSGCTGVDDLEPVGRLFRLRELDLSNRSGERSLAFLADLTGLQKLSLKEWKGLRTLSGLPTLPSLRVLELNGCSDLGEIQSLSRFTSLRDLNLSGCARLRWPGPFTDPPRLRTLELRSCKAEWPFEPLRPLLATLETLNLYESSFPDLPKELCDGKWGDNFLARIKAHFADLDQGEQEDAELKLFVLGNGGVGKTQLCRRLRGEQFDPTIPSTHGVQLGQITLSLKKRDSNARLRCWDFGGQDIYHGTHALFLQGHAVFVILWSPDLETGESVHGGVVMRNRPLAYWLDYVRGLADVDCPVLVVQSQCDEPTQRRPPPAEISGFRHVKVLELSALTGMGLAELTDGLAEAVARLLEARPLHRIGVGRVRVRDRLQEMLNMGVRTLSQQEFRGVCAETGKVSDPAALLDFLHRSGAVFYRPGVFADRIILDQTWAVEAIYTLFHRQAALPFLAGDGRFTREELAALVWLDLSEQEQELILTMMRSCGLCFPARKLSTDPPRFEYAAPDLLPEWSEAKGRLLGALRDGPPDDRAIARYRFLHEGILRTFLSRIGEQAGEGAVYWKYGCWFCEEKTNGMALVRSSQGTRTDQPGAGEVILEAWGRGAAKLVDRVLATLLGIPVGQPPAVERENGRRRSARAAESKGIEDLKIVPRYSLPAAGPRRVYVSYAWGDDSPAGREREAVVDSLCDHARTWGYRIERDKEVMRSGDLISDFIASIGRGDRVIVVLSEKYLHSEYCMNELHQIYSYSRSEKGDFLRRVVPLTLADAAIGTIRDRAQHALHWKTECEDLRPLLSQGVIGVSDYAAWARINRWVADVSEMLAHISDKLHPQGFEAIVADDFAKVRELLEQNIKSGTDKAAV